MTLPAALRVNVSAPFPARAQGSGPIVVTKSNGVYTIEEDFSILALLSQITSPDQKRVLVWDSITGSFNTVFLSEIRGKKVFYVADYCACDGVTDDTAALKSLGAIISAAGGNARIIFPFGGNILTFASGQAFVAGLGTLFDFSAGVNNVTIEGNGCTITNNHAFTGNDALYCIYCQGDRIRIDGLKFVQTNAVSLPAASPVGTVGVWHFTGTNLTVTNVSATGGLAPVLLSNSKRPFLVNITSTNCIYGLGANSGGFGQNEDIFAYNLTVDGTAHDRAVFLKAVSGADISVSSINAGSNDILLSTDTPGQIVENVRLNYRIKARTSGTPVSYVTIGSGAGATAGTVGGSIFRNIEVRFDADLSGDGSVGPIVKFQKGTANALGLVFENISFTGKISGVTNHVGNLFDLFTAADASWVGESADQITFRDLLVTGNATPAFFVDYTPLASTGSLRLFNTKMPGNYTDSNFSSTKRLTINAQFGNGLFVMSDTFGGIGVAFGAVGEFQTQPTTVNFGVAGDNAIFIPLPSGFSQLGTVQVQIFGASGNISTATFGLFTASGGGGAAILPAGTAITVTSGTANTNNNMQLTNATNFATEVFTPTGGQVFFRVGTTVAQTAKVVIRYTAHP